MPKTKADYVWGWKTLKIEAEFFRTFARDDSIHGAWDEESIFVGVTGREANDKNGVIVSAGADDDDILLAVNALRAAKNPASIFFVDQACTDSVLQRLSDEMITPDQKSVCMSVAIEDISDRQINPNVDIEPVDAMDELENWLDVAQKSGWMSDVKPEDDRRVHGRCLKSLVDSRSAKFCTAYLDGQVVGMAGMFINNGVSLLTDMAVLPEFQRRKVGTTLMNWWVSHCRRHGVKVLTLSPTPSSKKLYENFGLKKFSVPENAIFYVV